MRSASRESFRRWAASCFPLLVAGCVAERSGQDPADLDGGPMEVGATQEALRELDPYEYEFLVLLNEHRVDAGVPPVQPDRILNQVARDYAQFMADTDCFDHTECDGKTPWDRMCEGGFEPVCRGTTEAGENIAAGQWTGRDVFEAWRSSPGHNENMLRPSFRVVGIGRVEDPEGDFSPYWVNVFAGDPGEETYEPSGWVMSEDGGWERRERAAGGRGGGCACRVVGASGGADDGPAWLAPALLGLWLARRRRVGTRRRA